ncbi:MAG TPA: type II toxin-antitoxin system RelE/ParE family toxin [Methylocystis sp.]|nr:type II toxin-antitoxin system RelE/ParE family toxin [Methylocystis sp.]
MRLVWSRPAIATRREIFDYIRKEDPAAARRIVKRLRDRASSLQKNARQGRKGRIEGTFELYVSGTPYLIVYSIVGDEIRIIAILHHARQWPPA